MTTRDTQTPRGLELSLGFTVGLDMPFEESVEWASNEGFDFVEVLLDGPYTRRRIEGQRDSMQEALADSGLDIIVHLPFSIDIGSPFNPVREGIITEFIAGMDLAATLGSEKVVFHPSSDAWELGWTDAECLEFVHAGLDAVVPAANDRNLDPCLENVVSSYYDVTTFPELLQRYPEVSMTFDTSHALLAGINEVEMAGFCREHADRIGHLHLVDTRGTDDEHLPVGMGDIDFATVLRGLDDADWAGTATLEIGTHDYDTIALGKRHTVDLLRSL